MHLSNMLSSVLLVPVLASLALARSFNLYAYGTDIGGLPLYYADGNAVVGNGAISAVTNAVVSFTNNNGRLVGNPNTTESPSAFTNALLYVPGSLSSSHKVGFTTDETSTVDQVTDRFLWYGSTLLIENDTGQYTSQFYVRKSDAESGQYELLWGVSGTQYISVSLRSVAPSTSWIL
ncbi:uncharacterized protein BDV17DRAFT_295689 [Aspergillus undulatus]|uniref:uncharacterized protein n=1 Tax=Aspergillus undulatus TaxID=1810928 RepID=UPI003CCCF4AE